VLTIGNFDGVHVGHQEILSAAKRIASQKPARLVAMTFEPHPVAVLFPNKSPGILTPLSLKRCLLEGFGVDCLVVLESTPELLSLAPTEFVNDFIADAIAPSVVVEGRSFNFGSGRSGGVDVLRQLGAQKGFEVAVVDAKEVRLSDGRGVEVSSTAVRELLCEGRVADAVKALGRAYRLIGRVVPGQGKGKELGFPTANMEPPEQIVPCEGVYAGLVEIGESFEDVCISKEKMRSAFSIGQSSAYGGGNQLLIEAHLLREVVGELSGKWMAMDFVERIRSQIEFETESQLSEQITRDCQKVRDILAGRVKGQM
jgi:riboflavin kinase/FMN adenylyltransferase